jgi:biotin carboxyl carrier protein
MTFDVVINGRARRVGVTALGVTGNDRGRFRLSIREDRPAADVGDIADTMVVLDVRRTGTRYSLVDTATHRVIDAAVVNHGAGEMSIAFPHAVIRALLDSARFQRPEWTAAAGGDQRVMAPMSGRIVRVLVKPGESVIARQPLIVMEAMKMENELVSPRAGVVQAVMVAEGASVEPGCVLVALL